MVSSLREMYPNAFYHVYARGARRLNIFQDDKDFKKMLHIIEDASKKYNFVIHSFCLMNNHYHFLIETRGDKNEISRLMLYINSRFALFVNKRQELSGHVFEDRFQSKVIYDRTGLLRLIRYIERNPVKAKMVNQCEQWSWSSSSNLIRNKIQPKFLSQELIKNFFKKEKDCNEAFLEFINFDNQEEDLFNPLNTNEYMIFKIKKILKESPLKDSSHQEKLKAYLYKELTTLSTKEITSEFPNLSEQNVRKSISRINNDETTYSNEFKQISNQIRICMASQMPQGSL